MQDSCHSQLTEGHWHRCHCSQRSVGLQPFLTSRSPNQPPVPLAWPGRTQMTYIFLSISILSYPSQSKMLLIQPNWNLLLQNGAISKLISSTQTCNYQFDNRRKHMTEAQCTEKHLFIPFSHECVFSSHKGFVLDAWLMTWSEMDNQNRKFSC